VPVGKVFAFKKKEHSRFLMKEKRPRGRKKKLEILKKHAQKTHSKNKHETKTHTKLEKMETRAKKKEKKIFFFFGDFFVGVAFCCCLLLSVPFVVR